MACKDQALKTQRCVAVIKIPQLSPFLSAQDVTLCPSLHIPASAPTPWDSSLTGLGVLIKKVGGGRQWTPELRERLLPWGLALESPRSLPEPQALHLPGCKEPPKMALPQRPQAAKSTSGAITPVGGPSSPRSRSRLVFMLVLSLVKTYSCHKQQDR